MALPSSLRTRVTANPATTKTGAWQAQEFTAASVRSIGTWFLVGGNALASYQNGRTLLINPSRLITKADADGFGWHATWERWRRVYGSWPDAIDWLLDDAIVEHLAPNWMSEVGPSESAARPLIAFWRPNSSYNGGRSGTTIDFFAPLTARAGGLNHLVDGFFEALHRMDELGIKCSVHTGAPGEQNRFAQRCGTFNLNTWHRRPAMREMLALLEHSNALVGLDACVLQPQDGVDEALFDRLVARGSGVAIEGIPNPTQTVENAWIAKLLGTNAAIQTLYQNDAQRIGLAVAQSPTGQWPAVSSGSFNATYGSNRPFIFMMYENEPLISLSMPSDAWSNNSAADTYLAAYATKTRAIITALPNAKCLLPYQVLCLAGKRGYAISNFAP